MPLGVNGLCDCYGNHTMSYLIYDNTQAIIFDAGTGLSQLFNPQLAPLLRTFKSLDIVLSHYHLEHVIGLTSLIESWPDKPVTLHTPTKPLVDVSHGESAIDNLIGPPYLGKILSNIINLTITDFHDSPIPKLTLAGHQISTRRNNHSGGSVSFRIGDSIAYVTDTSADQSIVPFISNVDLLLHEIWLTDSEADTQPHEKANHASVSEVANLATKAKVKRLMPVHLRPSTNSNRPQDIVKQLQSACSEITVIKPRELSIIEL